MNETLEVEGKYMLEELAMSECSSRATLSPLPPVIPSKDIPGDGDLFHVQRLADEKMADDRAREQRAYDLKFEHLGPQPETIDDFIRNYFAKMGFMKTLAKFQAEWFEKEQKGIIKRGDREKVRSVYLENQLMLDQLARLKHEKSQLESQIDELKPLFSKLRKEKDYHKMHHSRLEQEKSKFIHDLKVTKTHYANYPEELSKLQAKYQSAMKEKMLITLERDRLVGILSSMPMNEEERETISGERKEEFRPTVTRTSDNDASSPKLSPRTETNTPSVSSGTAHETPAPLRDTVFPTDRRINPLMESTQCLVKSSMVTKMNSIRVSQTHVCHQMQVAWVDIHPNKHKICTASDDHTWQVVDMATGDCLLAGSGHSDWVSCAKFSPDGEYLATSSGDRSVRLWNLEKEACVADFDDHTQGTWSVAWHTCGQFIASCSMDNTAKIWDLGSQRCRNTLRGHNRAVMSCEFVYGSNALLTASTDKSMRLWDARTGLCHQNFLAHTSPINHATFSPGGNKIASIDCSGKLLIWDVRMIQVEHEINLGCEGHSATWEIGQEILAVGLDNGVIELVDFDTMKRVQLRDHESSVNCVQFDPLGELLVSCAADGTVKIWE